MQKINKTLEYRTKIYSKLAQTIGFLAGFGIGIYITNINNQINPEIDRPQIEIVRYEQNPHKYSPLRQVSDNPHHYIPNSK